MLCVFAVSFAPPDGGWMGCGFVTRQRESLLGLSGKFALPALLALFTHYNTGPRSGAAH
jgi:hypothetical protein